ncbi:opsin, ultraviolet-sensitive-like [Eriocheir sinensis]|uniref:opsin, ultraviolet-sensitive-like n=1 Tax=Eriocheir sinensis TaxID=95602 RepID=UPI0021C69110|nr:opsin, ultraviolet-sensitive-like [Eriocheir sinensis]XP_050698818.1 opsin, ultraviolet-sensitive-like [Eriocheir sinensis]
MFITNDTAASPVPAPLWGAGSGVMAAGRYEVKMLGYNTPPDYLEYVHPFWRTFEAPNPFLNYMLGVFYIFFGIFAVIGNGVVMWIFSTTKSLRTPSNMFVINLALMDFIMMLKTPVFVLNSFNDGPVWGKTGCDIFGLMGAFSGVGAASCNAVIAYDRYKTIAKPFEAKFSRGTAIAIVVVTWLYALPWTIMPYLEVWGRFVPEGFLTSCTFDYMTEDSNTKSFVATIFFFAYCVPSSIIFFCYSQIFGHVSAHEKAMRAQAKRMNVTNFRSVGTKEEQEKSAEIRIAKVAITIFFLFSISWVPYATVALIAAFGNRSLLTPLVAMIPACTCKTVACLDPWVYAINHPKYRLELMKRMPWFCVHEEAPSDTASASTTATKE